ncbi:MAG: hypothetical protein ABJF11_07990 [Reichenbachiella sp.]|uniref:tetratricopeptide repeat protein n=1 Tax=Reichenbachiella sp. TaxID=2184521 RepID=UPI0032634BB1
MSVILTHLLLIYSLFGFDTEIQKEVDDLNNLCKVYYRSNPDTVKILANRARQKAANSDYSFGLAKSLFFLGAIADQENRPDEAVPYLLDALTHFASVNSKTALSNQAEVCVTLGKIFKQHHHEDEAIEFYEQGIQYAVSAENNKALRKLLYNQSGAYRKKQQFTVATDLLMQSLEFIKPEDNVIKQRTYNQLGAIYYEIGELTSSRVWFNKMILLDSGGAPSRYSGQAYHNIALTYQKENNFENAWKYYLLAIREKEKINNARDLFVTYKDVTEMSLNNEQYDMAMSYAHKALSLLDQVPKTPEYYELYDFLSSCLLRTDPNKALHYSRLYAGENKAFLSQQKQLIAAGDKYKVQLITSNYFYKIEQAKERIKLAWTASCMAAFLFLAFLLTIKIYNIYNYKSPSLALSHIKNQKEMIYLLDLFRREKEEMKKTLRQKK